MVFVDGVCTFMSQRLVGYPYIVALKLIPDKDVKIDIDYLLDEISKNNKKVNRRSSWSKKWTIFRLYAKDNTYTSNSTLVTELVVWMTYRSKITSPVKLMDSIETNLKISSFVLIVGNTSYTFRQTLSEYYQFTRYSSIDGFGSNKVHSISDIKSISNQTVLHKIYEEDFYVEIPSVHFPVVSRRLDEITPTRFCDMIQLNDEEYVMYAASIIFYKMLNIYFIDGQFDMTTDEHGENVVKICLSESGFRVTNNVPPISSRTDIRVYLWIWSSVIYIIY